VSEYLLMVHQYIWTLWCKGRLTEADTPTIRLGATPSGLEVCTGQAARRPGPFGSGRAGPMKLCFKSGRAGRKFNGLGRLDRPVIFYVLGYFCNIIYISAYFLRTATP